MVLRLSIITLAGMLLITELASISQAAAVEGDAPMSEVSR